MKADGSNNGARDARAISAEDASDLIKAYFESGVENLFSAREAAREIVNERLDQMDAEAEAVAERGECPHGKDGAYQRLNEHEAERQRLLPLFHSGIPTWQQISGLFKNQERHMSPNERARRIRILLANVERMLRHELKHGAAEFENLPPARYTGPSLQWSPLRNICFHIELAQQRLSAYSREQTGMSAPEVVDCIRAEELRPKMKAQLREFARDYFKSRTAKSTTEDTEGTEEKQGEEKALADEIWFALKETRKAPRWHRTTWAAGYGFSSYSKFFRACLLCYGKTPHQLEIELIDEILLEAEKNGDGDENGGHEGHEGHEDGRKEHEGTSGEVKDAALVKRE